METTAPSGRPNFTRDSNHAKQVGGLCTGLETPAEAAPRCIFKSHSFTSDAPPATRYDFGAVPNCKPDLTGSVLLRPSSRRQWFVCIHELESLAQESLDRRASRLQMNTPSGLPLVYIADRMDIDDPLWGYQVRCSRTGWLQGFITVTTFTTWTHFFEWNSTHLSSGMAAARVANSFVGKHDKALYMSDGNETVHVLASRLGLKATDLVAWNVQRFPNITVNSRIQAGTLLYVMDPCQADKLTVDKAGETVRKVSSRHGIEPADLILLNSQNVPDLTPNTKLQPGVELIYRDRAAEPDVFLPTQKQRRELDYDFSLAAELQQQHHYGDPTTTGVVWPRVAEIALLAGLGCGKVLVRLALEELCASGDYDFAVMQATMASVSFYEELGFVRVGAIARYLPEGTSLEANPVQGYRHWACADESSPEQFGDTSYMMALKLKKLGKEMRVSKQLAKRLVREWPAVQSSAPRSGKARANQAGIMGGAALQVGDMSLNIADGDDARLQLRYEVELVLEEDSSAGRQLVKWKHLSKEDATWESADSELLQTDAAREALAHFRKHGPHTTSEDAGLEPLSSIRKRPAPSKPPRWNHCIVRSTLPTEPTASPRIFNGGLGEPLRAPLEEDATLSREHRYWLVVRFAASSGKCTLVPLIASGRFGGCGRRAGRIRWKPAPLKQGHDREAHTSTLQVVPADSVTGAREVDGEAWCIDDGDADQAAREQAAAARNKRRRLLDDAEVATGAGVYSLGLFPRSCGGSMGGSAPKGPRPSKPAGGAPARIGGLPPRKKKRLAPASSSCLACTKGKHCAHTCGVRGKRNLDLLVGEQADADGLGEGEGESAPALSVDGGPSGSESSVAAGEAAFDAA